MEFNNDKRNIEKIAAQSRNCTPEGPRLGEGIASMQYIIFQVFSTFSMREGVGNPESRYKWITTSAKHFYDYSRPTF